MYGNQKINKTSNSCMMMLNAVKIIFSLNKSFIFFGQTTGDFLTILKPFLRTHIYFIVCYYYVFEKILSKTGRKEHHIQTQIMPLSVITGLIYLRY